MIVFLLFHLSYLQACGEAFAFESHLTIIVPGTRQASYLDPFQVSNSSTPIGYL